MLWGLRGRSGSGGRGNKAGDQLKSQCIRDVSRDKGRKRQSDKRKRVRYRERDIQRDVESNSLRKSLQKKRNVFRRKSPLFPYFIWQKKNTVKPRNIFHAPNTLFFKLSFLKLSVNIIFQF